MILFWIGGVLLALTAATSALFFALFLSTGEAVPLVRAKAFYRWSVVVVLGTFNLWIFGRIIAGLRALM